MIKYIIVTTSILFLITACSQTPEKAFLEIDVKKAEKAMKIKGDSEQPYKLLFEVIESINPVCKSLDKDTFSAEKMDKKDIQKGSFALALMLKGIGKTQKKLEEGKITKLSNNDLKIVGDLCDALKKLEK